MEAAWSEVSAPCSLMLCGGWALALDRRATVRVERRPGALEIEWPDRPREATEAGGSGLGLGFARELLERRGLAEGARVILRCRVAEESGLAPQEALSVALERALELLLGAPSKERRPQGPRAAAAWSGGVAGSWAEGPPRRLPCDPARVEESLVLAESGWPAEGEAHPLPLDLEAWLSRHDGAAALGPALTGCWPPPPEPLRPLAGRASAAGGGAWLAGGTGGLLTAWLPADRRAGFLEEVRAAGLRPVGARVDLLGCAAEGHG